MVQIIQKLEPTEDEAFFMIRAAKRIKLYHESVPCPRCGKQLLLQEIGKSFTVSCSNPSCIDVSCRGI